MKAVPHLRDHCREPSLQAGYNADRTRSTITGRPGRLPVPVVSRGKPSASVERVRRYWRDVESTVATIRANRSASRRASTAGRSAGEIPRSPPDEQAISALPG
jgi:hypothetical protein